MRSRDGVTFRARDGVTSRDGVMLGPRDGVTSDVIGHLAPQFPVRELVLGIKNLAPAQDVDLPLAYPQFEHLIARIAASITAVPDRTLNLPSGARSTVKVQPPHIKRVSDASERLMATPPFGGKAHRKNLRRSAAA